MKMKKQLLSLLVLLIFSFSVFAQKSIDKQIENIRKTYTEVSQKIESTEKDEESGRTSELAVNELVINKLNKSWSAVGNYRVVFKFYYQNKDEEPYPTQLLKVTKKSEISARNYYEEYLYDKEGNLIFYFEKSEDGEFPEERRIYFNKQKPIRIIEDKAKREKLTKADKSTAEKVLKKNQSIKQIFINSIEN